MLPDNLTREGERVLTICNACRYCEGYCPVFPAVEQRLSFSQGDLTYLANLCHNCSECLYACQYAPPHEFGVNIPRTLAEIRVASYKEYCWPKPLAAAFDRSAVKTILGLVLAMTIAIAALTIPFRAEGDPARGDFYAIVPHGVMIGLFGSVFLFIMAALAIGLQRFWRDMGPYTGARRQGSAIVGGLRAALTLDVLHGNAIDCTHGEEARSPLRRWFHHATFYGFMLCFASTCVAALYHTALGWRAPYPLASVPVVLGTVGGIGLLVGPAGLFAIRLRRDPMAVDPTQRGLDVSFLTLLFLTSVTGLLLLAVRDGAAMSTVLIVHLGVVLTLFVTLPYGKFVHGIYRTAALIRFSKESSETPERSDGVLVPTNGSDASAAVPESLAADAGHV